MNQAWLELLKPLPDYLGGHMLLSMVALLVGLIISLPLGIAASRRPKLAEFSLSIAGVIQTVPTLALLVLMVPLLGGAIGFWPAFIALTLYGILPMLANTVVGIRGVDPALTEAARGLGMSDRQMLLRVQLPLALPVLIGGLRTATVLVVGTATLATPVGWKSLGNYIFSGLEMNNMRSAIFGCVMAALLALVMDQLVRLLEVAARKRSRRLAGVALIGLLIVLGGGLYAPVVGLFARRPIIVASGPFTEQHILSDVMKTRLESSGFSVDDRQSMGESIQFLALRSNKIDCCVNYTGNVWVTLMGRTTVDDKNLVFDETTRFLKEEYGVECLGKLGFEDAYCLAMRKDLAEKYQIKTIADLQKYAPDYKIAGDMQFFQRPEWTSVRETYGLKFKDYEVMDASIMYPAIKAGTVGVICAYSSDGRLKDIGAGRENDDLVILDDPKKAFPPYDAILLLSPNASKRDDVKFALRRLVSNGPIKIESMRKANLLVDVENQTPRVAADKLLEEIAR